MQEISDKLAKAVNLDDLEDWLETKAARSIVGYAASPDMCPVANYCKDIVGNSDFYPYVAPTYIFNNCNLSRNLLVTNPPTIVIFINMVDDITLNEYCKELYPPITKEQALSFIQRIKAIG